MANCTVTGSVKTLIGTAVTDAVISVSVVTPFFDGDGNLISGQIATTTTDSLGAFSIAVLQTTALGKLLTWTINYNLGSGQRKDKKYNLYTPDSTTALFSDMVAQSNVPHNITTIPALNVTVSAISGLTSNNVQDALAELEDQINTVDVDLTGPISATAGVTSITAQTGTGTVFVVDTAPTIQSPTLVAPALGTPVNGVATNLTGTATALNIGGNAATATLAATATNVTTNANLTGPITSVGNATSIASKTGTGTKFVVDTSPTLVTPDIGVATATTINGTSIPSSQTLATRADNLGVFASTTSAQLLGVISDETGTGALVFANAPTLVGPALGTPISGVATNLTGTATALNIGGNAATATLASTVTTNANLTGDVTSVGNATTLTNAPVIAKVLTGYTSGAGTVSASDSILQAIQKLNGNDATNANLTGDVTSVGNATTLTNAPVIAKVLTGYTSGAGTVSAADSILSAIQKLNGNDATNANLTGPVTSTGNATAVTNNAITNAMLAQIATATFKGRTTAATGNVEDLTATQATALLNAMVGDSGSGGTKGLVPAPASGDAAALKVLRADGTWGAAGTTSPLSTKGDLYTWTSTNARHAVPSDYGFLVPDSGATDGWRNSSYTSMNGSPGKNYIQYADFENNATTGWTATGCATVTNGLPVSVGSGAAAFSSSNGGRTKGANTNSPAINSSSAVSGTYSLNLATTGAGVIGDGYISSLYAIDASDQAKVLSYKLNYKVASGTPVMAGTSANTYAVAIYDPVNNSWLPVAGGFNFVQSSGVGIAQGTCQTASNTTSIQIFIYSPVAPTGTSSLLIDDVYVGPQALAFGPSVDDFAAYTPTFTGFGTPTGVSVYSRRVGDSLEIHGTLTTGTMTGSTAQMSLGYKGANANVTIDTAKIASSNTVVGQVTRAGASAAYFSPTILSVGANTYVQFGAQTSTLGGNTPAAGNQIFSNGEAASFYLLVPISGWSSNTVMSADSDTRVVALQVSTAGPTATITSSMSLLKFGAGVVSDSHGGFSTSTGQYTIPVSGYYRFTVSCQIAATYVNTKQAGLGIGKNSTSTASYQFTQVAGAAEGVLTPSGSCTILCTAGDVISPLVYSDATSPTVSAFAPLNYFMAERLSGPATIAASESINARYVATSTVSIASSDTTIVYDTKTYDSHNAFASNTFTAPTSGKYRITASTGGSTAWGASPTLTLTMYKNAGAVSPSMAFTVGSVSTGTYTLYAQGSDEISLAAGDSLLIKGKVNTGAVTSTASLGYITISRVGN